MELENNTQKPKHEARFHFIGYFCSQCDYVISNLDSIYWDKDQNGVICKPHCAYHKFLVEPRFEEKIKEIL